MFERPRSSGPPATVGDAVAWAGAYLSAAGIEGARLDAQVLLGRVVGLARAGLLAAPERALSDGEVAAYRGLVERRRAGEPLAYITGVKEWLDLTLAVDRRVLIPRPETEELAERAIAWARGHDARLAVDVGTGSGALAIALARHVPSLRRVIAVDVSSDALDVARANCRALGVDERVDPREGSLLGPLHAGERPQVVVANLPYVPRGELEGLMRDVREFEPHVALVGGARGDELIQEMLTQARARLTGPAALFLELHHDQGDAVSAAARRLWPAARVDVRRDYAGLQRIVEIELAPP